MPTALYSAQSFITKRLWRSSYGPRVGSCNEASEAVSGLKELASPARFHWALCGVRAHSLCFQLSSSYHAGHPPPRPPPPRKALGFRAGVQAVLSPRSPRLGSALGCSHCDLHRAASPDDAPASCSRPSQAPPAVSTHTPASVPSVT